jgi:hypothetical protein
MVMNYACKYSNKGVNHSQNDQTKESAGYSINNENNLLVSYTGQGNDVSIFKDKEGEKSIKYISWENVIKFINDETFALLTYNRATGEEAEYFGTYALNVHENITFLDIHFDNGDDDRWLILANGTLCDIYMSEGKHIHGVTGSVNRDENISFWPGIISTSSYLIENDILYSSSNLNSTFRTDIPWAEGVEGNGIGEKIFFEKAFIHNGSMHISIGFVSYDRPYLYYQNSRPKTIRLSVENKFSFVVELRDTPHYQEIKFPSDISQDDILVLEILDVYPGTKFEDTCINTILFELNSGFYAINNYWE